MKSDSQVYRCICHHPEHHLFVDYEEEDDFVNIMVFLDHHRFPRRLWEGILYIFGKKSRFGQYGNIILGKDDVDRLSRQLQRLNFYLQNNGTIPS